MHSCLLKWMRGGPQLGLDEWVICLGLLPQLSPPYESQLSYLQVPKTSMWISQHVELVAMCTLESSSRAIQACAAPRKIHPEGTSLEDWILTPPYPLARCTARSLSPWYCSQPQLRRRSSFYEAPSDHFHVEC